MAAVLIPACPCADGWKEWLFLGVPPPPYPCLFCHPTLLPPGRPPSSFWHRPPLTVLFLLLCWVISPHALLPSHCVLTEALQAEKTLRTPESLLVGFLKCSRQRADAFRKGSQFLSSICPCRWLVQDGINRRWGHLGLQQIQLPPTSIEHLLCPRPVTGAVGR